MEKRKRIAHAAEAKASGRLSIGLQNVCRSLFWGCGFGIGYPTIVRKLLLAEREGFELRDPRNMVIQLGLSRTALIIKEFPAGSILSCVFISLIRCHS